MRGERVGSANKILLFKKHWFPNLLELVPPQERHLGSLKVVFLNDHHLFCILDLKFFLCPRKPNLIKCTPLCILQTPQACGASHCVTLAGAESCINTSFLGWKRKEEAKNQWGACLLVGRAPPQSQWAKVVDRSADWASLYMTKTLACLETVSSVPLQPCLGKP